MKIPHPHWWKRVYTLHRRSWYRCRFCRELGFEIPR